jgi:hypothetical protein
MNNLLIKLNEYYNILPKFTYNDINISISKNYIKQQEFRQYREEKCNFLEFEYPTRHQLVYDFKINDKKIQEKTGHITNNKEHQIQFNIQKSNGKNKQTPYQEGDNDFYWLHCPDKEHFLIIPEDYVIGTPSIFINFENTGAWYNDFLFKYSSMCEIDIINIFKN